MSVHKSRAYRANRVGRHRKETSSWMTTVINFWVWLIRL